MHRSCLYLSALPDLTNLERCFVRDGTFGSARMTC
ncbi:Protein of unknown function [Pyronema omphalodes CBS 100304]|uniref:Uncharacterized protein n=1 Tax=Pyronema omphalodes (strain CBS 100304) TaxID=1076935 RepID=U4L432_PYROM|nr:Protein of unknown function [Pyronema omphalodes CBS 100304]